MNNEPVAWFYAYPDDIEEKFLCSNSELIETMKKKKGYTLTPLYTHPVSQYKAITNTKIEPTVVSYTHPVKELTDEEISQVYKEVSEPFGEKRLYEIHSFARAILRKAQEK